MNEQVYQELYKKLNKRGGLYPAMDIPEFYNLAQALFTEDEAEVFNAIPAGYHPSNKIASDIGRDEKEISNILEDMADKGLCVAGEFDGTYYYGVYPLHHIFEFQFMRGASTDRDKKIAKLIYAFKKAVYKSRGPLILKYPATRVIPIDRKIKVGNTIHTYHQVASYIEKYKPLAVSTCYCRQEAKLIDENDICTKPFEVCLTFGIAAQFVIDRGIGRKISEQEATGILKKSEEAGLVHCSHNRQEIDFLCNCCRCHCVMLDLALSQPKPGQTLNSGFYPIWNTNRCESCKTCIEKCPTFALKLGDDNILTVNLDYCIGCGVCATCCPQDALQLIERQGIQTPPFDQNGLAEAVKNAEKGAF